MQLWTKTSPPAHTGRGSSLGNDADGGHGANAPVTAVERWQLIPQSPVLPRANVPVSFLSSLQSPPPHYSTPVFTRSVSLSRRLLLPPVWCLAANARSHSARLTNREQKRRAKRDRRPRAVSAAMLLTGLTVGPVIWLLLSHHTQAHAHMRARINSPAHPWVIIQTTPWICRKQHI